jgi:hypothetical protein
MTGLGQMPRLKHNLLLLCLFTAAVTAAFAVRTFICARDTQAIRKAVNADFVPYLVESSIMYGFARDAGTGKGIPEYDQRLIGMEHIKVSEQMPLGVEYFLGCSWRLKNFIFGRPALTPEQLCYDSTPDAAAFMRFLLRFWTSLTAGVIFLWLYWLGCPLLFAFGGAMLHAVAPAAVVRHTGQDILCEAFALPFIALAFACRAAALRYQRPLLTGLSGAAVFAATAFWDMSQICFLLYVIYELLRWLCGGELSIPRLFTAGTDQTAAPVNNSRRYQLLLLWFAVLVLSALLVPYNRAHRLLCSPLLMLAFPAVLSLPLWRWRGNWRRRLTLLLLTLAALGALWYFTSAGYKQNYNHFQALISAKLQYGNVKPADPDKLDFASRFLWTPSLHSATMAITANLFPAAFWLMLLTLLACVFFRRGRTQFGGGISRYGMPLWLSLIFFILFIYMVRFHVLCALFMAVAFPLIMYELSRIGRKSYIAAVMLLLAALLLEADTVRNLRRSYPENFLNETANLVKWLRAEKTDGKIMLADMGLSPILKCYNGAAILIQPKFELPQTRNIVETYVMTMFHGSESDFAKFCGQYNVDLVIFNRNIATDPMHPYSYRYMAAAKTINKNAVASIMDTKPNQLNYFYAVAPPAEYKDLSRRYIVFKFISPRKKILARDTAELAKHYWENGNIPLAEKLATAAYITDPTSQQTYLTYYKVFQRIPNFSLNQLLIPIRSH